MVSLVRSGPKILLVTSNDKKELIIFLKKKFNAVLVKLETVADNSEENHTIIYIVEYQNQDKTEYIIKDALIIYEDALVLLAKLYTLDKHSPIETITVGPHNLILRSSGNIDEVVTRVQEDFGGTIGSYDECINNSFSNTSIIGVTNEPIYKKLTHSDFSKNFIRIDKDYFNIKQQLRMHSIKYLKYALEDHEWSDVEIKIYDSYGAYELHYKRLLLVLDSLQLGLIIGESWTKDRPRPLLLIDVYSINYVSFKSVEEIKRILFGLEYLEDGTRVVDYDLFEGKNKFQWSMLYKKEGKLDKKAKAKEARMELLEELPTSAVKELLELEDEIIKSRY